MLKVKFFHLPKPKRFKYTPRYFDPKKEERDRLKAENKLSNSQATSQQSIQGAFTQRLAARRKTRKSSNIRLLILIAIFAIIGWWLFT
ncbi:MAG: hypothetical protein PHU27_03895 [Salinivirgaceae bacterium]|nr:hypothetical protein [Salinivirgaceae bacterium]MDD4747536.1 hypothetical protein [Salinivirgaceae bacterium]MDY0280032.1 hypothetical protein [Salinivirgaceae bacterium]